MKSLLSNGSDPGLQTADGFTALHLAVFNMHVDVVKVLLEAQPNIVDVSTKAGMIALHVAAVNDDIDVIKLLLKAGAKPSDQRLNAPIHFAASAGNINAIKTLKDANTNISPRNRDGLTPLHFAALYDEVNVMEFLKAAGAAISLRDPEGRAPIHMAAFSGKVTTIKVLMEEWGVDSELRDSAGRTPLHYVGGSSNFNPTTAVSEAMSIDIGKGTEFELQRLAETAATLINAGASVLCRDHNGCTPVFYAALNGRVEVISILSGGWANVSSQDNKGATPIFYAAKGGHVDVIKALVDAGGSVQARDHDGRTAMCYAACNGHVKAIEALKTAGAGVSTHDEDGSTPIFHAAKNGHIDAIKVLIKLGADPEAKNLKGEAPSALVELMKLQNSSDVKTSLNGKLASLDPTSRPASRVARAQSNIPIRVSQTIIPPIVPQTPIPTSFNPPDNVAANSAPLGSDTSTYYNTGKTTNAGLLPTSKTISPSFVRWSGVPQKSTFLEKPLATSPKLDAPDNPPINSAPAPVPPPQAHRISPSQIKSEKNSTHRIQNPRNSANFGRSGLVSRQSMAPVKPQVLTSTRVKASDNIGPNVAQGSRLANQRGRPAPQRLIPREPLSHPARYSDTIVKPPARFQGLRGAMKDE